MVSEREIEAASRFLGDIPPSRIEAALMAAKIAAWVPITHHATGAFPITTGPVLAFFPPQGRCETSRVQVVERFDGWVPSPALWMPVVVPNAVEATKMTRRAVKAAEKAGGETIPSPPLAAPVKSDIVVGPADRF